MKKFTNLSRVLMICLISSAVLFSFAQKENANRKIDQTLTKGMIDLPAKTQIEKSDAAELNLSNTNGVVHQKVDKAVATKIEVSNTNGVSANTSPVVTNGEVKTTPVQYDPNMYPTPKQGGEDVSTATAIGSLPYQDFGTTAGYVDDYDEVCPYSGSTSPDVVYSYTPAANMAIDLDLCGEGSLYDTKLYVYENSVTPGSPFACNDDACSNSTTSYLSQIVNLSLTSGNTYYIVVDGYGGASGDYELNVVENTATPPPNDDCANAEAINAPYPTTVNGTTIGATVDCPGVLDWNAVWYEVELPYATNNVTIDYCGTTPVIANTGIVYYNDCTDCNAYVVSTGYDFTTCADGNPTVWWDNVPGPGTILIPAYIGAAQDFVLNVDVVEPVPCDLTCPTGSIDENEPDILDDQEDVTNGGCNGAAAPYDFTAITLGDTYCGNSNTYLYSGSDYRDTDWYRLDLSGATESYELTWEVEAEFDVLIYLLDAGTPEDCSNTGGIVSQSASAGDCEVISVTATVTPGIYYCFVAPSVFTGYPAGGDWEYYATLTGTPAGTGPANDDCANAEVIGDVTDQPYSTSLATFDAPGGHSGFITSPNIWYNYTATGNGDLTIDLCGSGYDTKLAVYDSHDCATMVEVANNDDACGLQSEVVITGVTAGDEFKIEVGGYGTAVGDGDITISMTGPCDITCPTGSIDENEPDILDDQEDVTNGGCNGTAPYDFSPISLGDTYCGNSNTYLYSGSDYRDTDWYRLDLSGMTDDYILNFEVEAEFDVLVYLLDAGTPEDCNSVGGVVAVSATAGPCEVTSVSATVAPGVYYCFVGPSVFTGYPAGGDWEYYATLTGTVAPTFDCDWTITGWDDYGDGWNGGQIEVFVDGTPALTWTGPAAAGPETVSFGVNDPSSIDIVWTAGGWPYEASYEVYDNMGVSVFQDGFGGVDPVGVTGLAGYCADPLDHDVRTISIDVPGLLPPGPYTPMATVDNNGANTETFDVTMTITGGYSSTKTVTGLAPGASQQVSFDSWTVAEGGYTIDVCTQLATDMDNTNDCMTAATYSLADKTFYAYNAYDPTSAVPVGPISFTNTDPGTITSIADQSAENPSFAGTWADGVWYHAIYTENNLISMDPATGARTVIGPLGAGINGLAYDVSTGVMYGIDYDGGVPGQSALYTIDMATGAATLVGGTSGGELLINLASPSTGGLYSVDLATDVFGSIDPATGAFTPIGGIGFDANYAQDMEFDRENDFCYMAAYNNGGPGGQLYIADVATGGAALIGDFAGGMEVCGFGIPYSPGINVDLTAFLEGPYDAALKGGMATDLNVGGEIPLNQPYSGAPWNYAGTESVAAIPNGDVVDWVLVELRETATNDPATATGATMIDMQAAFILSDGSIVGLDGSSALTFDVTINDYMFVVVWHRNHLPVLSNFALTETGGVYAYDFTTDANQVYGGNLSHKEVEAGVWALVAGDGDANGQVDNADKNVVWNSQSGTGGYLMGDFNMDVQVDNADKNIYWYPNSGSGSGVPYSMIPEGGYKSQVPK